MAILASMACLRAWMVRLGLGLVAVGVGCGGDPGAEGSETEGESTGAGPAPTSTTTTGTSGLPNPDGGPDGGLPGGGSTLDDGGGSSGGVEDTVFGMSDDMPLVADIPDIKRGELDLNTWVSVQQVQPISGRATFARDEWFYVQDPAFEEDMGLRVILPSGDAVPSLGRTVDLEGWVHKDEQGWLLYLDWALEGSPAEAVPPRSVLVSTLNAANAAVLDDALVDVVEPSGLVVRRRGTLAGTVLVGGATTRGVVLVDLRPFGLDVDLPPGTHLSRLQGVVEMGGSQPVILPRDGDDLVVAQ